MRKRCNGCRQLKPVEAFTKGRTCDLCREIGKAYRAIYLATWRATNGARSSREWRRRNPEYERERYAVTHKVRSCDEQTQKIVG